MKQYFNTFLFSLLTSAAIYAQQSLSGTIKDTNNTKLAGVIINIPSIHKSTISNASGYYEITNIPAGNYIIELTLLGYKSMSKNLSIKSDTHLDLTMEESVREISEVVITTAADAMHINDNPLPIKVISMKDVNENPSTNLIESVSKKNGVWALSTGPGIAKPIIRGLGYNRTLVLVNGIRQEGQQWGDEHGVDIDQFSIKKVEIIKGPGSIMFGSDALAGAINFIPYNDFNRNGWSGDFQSGFQSNNSMFYNTMLLKHKGNKFKYYIQGTQKDASNYQNAYDGKVFNSGFNERNFSAMFGINKNWGYSNFYASAFMQKMNMVEGRRDSTGRFTKFIYENNKLKDIAVSDQDLKGYEFNVPYQIINHFRLQNYTVINLKSGSKLILNNAYQYNIRNEYGPAKLVEAATNGSGEEEENGQLSMHLQTFNYNARYIKNINDNTLFSTGISGMAQMNTNRGDEYIIPDYFLIDGGAYAYLQKSVRNWNFSGGLRIDNRNFSTESVNLDSMGKVSVFLHPGGKQQFAALQKNYTNISGSIGFTYKITEQFYFKMNFARGFRAPSISEITSNGAHEGTIRFEYGNANLKPEINHQLDMGIELNTKHIGISITPFFNRIDNFIYYRKIASLKGGDSTLLEKDSKETLYAFTYNQGTAIVYGGEAAIEIHPHPLDWLHIESDFSYLNNQQLNHPDSTKYLPFMPPPRWVNEIKTEWNNLGKNIKSFYIKGELVYNFAQDHFFKAYNTETRTPDYTLINAVTGIKIKQSEHVVFEINAGVNNIMDIAYQSHLNRLKYLPINLSTGRQGVFNMGRNIFVNVAVRF